jgi:hypothetical protein
MQKFRQQETYGHQFSFEVRPPCCAPAAPYLPSAPCLGISHAVSCLKAEPGAYVVLTKLVVLGGVQHEGYCSPLDGNEEFVLPLERSSQLYVIR